MTYREAVAVAFLQALSAPTMLRAPWWHQGNVTWRKQCLSRLRRQAGIHPDALVP